MNKYAILSPQIQEEDRFTLLIQGGDHFTLQPREGDHSLQATYKEIGQLIE